MSLLEYPSARSSSFLLDEIEDTFRAWVHDPAKPDVVDLGAASAGSDRRVVAPRADIVAFTAVLRDARAATSCSGRLLQASAKEA